VTTTSSGTIAMLRVTGPDVLHRLNGDLLLPDLLCAPGRESPVAECARRPFDTNEDLIMSRCSSFLAPARDAAAALLPLCAEGNLGGFGVGINGGPYRQRQTIRYDSVIHLSRALLR
jgi:hypothetical protein